MSDSTNISDFELLRWWRGWIPYGVIKDWIAPEVEAIIHRMCETQYPKEIAAKFIEYLPESVVPRGRAMEYQEVLMIVYTALTRLEKMGDERAMKLRCQMFYKYGEQLEAWGDSQ